jgi:hypothetical protein
MAGEKTVPTKPRAGANQRFDLTEFQALATVGEAFMEGLTRALVATPKSTAGQPVGERWTGSITANPTSGSDNLVRVDSAVFVGVDSNGKLVVKPNGTAISTSIAADSTDYQVYLYMLDVAENTQNKRFIPVSSPWSEFGQAVATALRGTATLYVRSGGSGSVVAEDTVSGVTRSLLFLGIANNTGGNVTFTPAANTLETVTAPSTAPSTSSGTTAGETTTTGSGSTLRDLLNVVLYNEARNRWKGSNNLTASAANNYGAYTEPPGGIDAAFRGRTVVTIGDDSDLVYGDIDRDKYANDSLAIVAAIALLPSVGGTVLIKAGLSTPLTLAADIALAANKSVCFKAESWRQDAVTINMAQYKFTCAASASVTTLMFENVYLSSTHASQLGCFIDLHDNWQLIVRGCTFLYVSANAASSVHMITYSGAATTLAGVWLLHSEFSWSNADSNDDGGVFAAAVALDDFYAVGCLFKTATVYYPTLVYMDDARDNVVFLDCVFESNGTSAGASTSLGVTGISLATSSNATASLPNRVVKGCAFVGKVSGTNRSMVGVTAEAFTGLKVLDCTFANCTRGVALTGAVAWNADTLIRGCSFYECYGIALLVNPTASAVLTGLWVVDNLFRNNGGGVTQSIQCSSTGTLQGCIFEGNYLHGGELEIQSTVDNVRITNNRFEWLSGAEYYPIYIDSAASSGEQLAIRGNTVVGARTTAQNVKGAIYVRFNDIYVLDVCDNQFEDIQNVVYAGGSVLDYGVVLVAASSHHQVRVDGNSFRNVATALSGANARKPRLVWVTSENGSTVNAVGRGISVCNNESGPDTAEVSLVTVDAFTDLRSVKINDNNFVYEHYATLGAADDDIVVGATGCTARSVQVCNNQQTATLNSGGTCSTFMLSLRGTFYGISVTDNLWFGTSALGFASGFGLHFSQANLYHFRFDGNSFSTPTTSLTQANFFVTVPIAETSNPTFPSAASYYGGTNINVRRP